MLGHKGTQPKYENLHKIASEALGVSFCVPKIVTVSQAWRYLAAGAEAVDSESVMDDELRHEKLWRAARTLISDWKCNKVPRIDFDPETATGFEAAAITAWAGRAVYNFFCGIEEVPKA